VQAWVDAVRSVGGAQAQAWSSARDLAARYREPHRRYHGLGHVVSVLRDSAELATELGLGAEDRAILALAACAHDVVYDARPGEDERASAVWARAALTSAGVPAAVRDRVGELVLATITHAAPPEDLLAAALLDADLAILGAAPGEYSRYVDAVRAEYAAVPDDAWRTGRARVLRNLLAREPVYVTAGARLRWEAGARRNMSAELRELDA
jgi:predicted metal-dependent HD superfamily phosphohydrolase